MIRYQEIAFVAYPVTDMGLFREVGVSNGSLNERLVAADSHPGIASSSPGLRGTSYPGKSCKPRLNPNGVVAALDTLGHNSDGVGSHWRGVPKVAPPLFLGRGISTAVAHCKHLGCINGEGLSERAGSQSWALSRNPFGIVAPSVSNLAGKRAQRRPCY